MLLLSGHGVGSTAVGRDLQNTYRNSISKHKGTSISISTRKSNHASNAIVIVRVTVLVIVTVIAIGIEKWR